MKYDYLVVGSGLYGAIFAHEAKKHGHTVLVVEKRDHIGADVAAKAEVAVPMAVTTNASANTRLQIVFFFMVFYSPFLIVLVGRQP